MSYYQTKYGYIPNFKTRSLSGFQKSTGHGQLKLTVDNNYDIEGRRLTNTGYPQEDEDSSTKKYVDVTIADKLSNIELVIANTISQAQYNRDREEVFSTFLSRRKEISELHKDLTNKTDLLTSQITPTKLVVNVFPDLVSLSNFQIYRLHNIYSLTGTMVLNKALTATATPLAKFPIELPNRYIGKLHCFPPNMRIRNYADIPPNISSYEVPFLIDLKGDFVVFKPTSSASLPAGANFVSSSGRLSFSQ